MNDHGHPILETYLIKCNCFRIEILYYINFELLKMTSNSLLSKVNIIIQ